MMRIPSINNLTYINLSVLKPYFDLCKIRVVALMLLTTIVGMFLASPGFVPFSILISASLGIGLSACAGAAFNHIIDRHLDALMTRTSHRPIPSGKISAANALIFAGILAFIGMLILLLFVNVLTAFLTLLTLIGYAGIYTLYLKRATSQNIVIGGLAGAAPPLLGWTAVTGQIGIPALLLMLIIFVWTPPHFWALAIHRYKEYKNADIPMLPVSYGIPYTKLSVLLYTILLAATSLLPYVIGTSGLIYLFGTIILNIVFLYWACMLMWSSRPLVAMQTFRYSITYLMLLFVLLLVDHYFIF